MYAESLVPLLHFGWSDLRVLREGRFKYIQAPRPELYDLQDDPGETTNLAPRGARARGGHARGARPRSSMPSARGEGVRSSARRRARAAGEAGRARLRGRVGARRDDDARRRPQGQDRGLPGRERPHPRGAAALHDRDYAAERGAASGPCWPAASRASRSTSTWRARSPASARHAEAARHFEEATRRSPSHGPAWDGPGAQPGRGRTRRRRPAARSKAALPLAPTNGALRARARRPAARQGDVAGAIRLQAEATRAAPDVAAYWNSLGMTLGGNGRPAEAERAFREAARLDEKNHRYAYNLGLDPEAPGTARRGPPLVREGARAGPALRPRPRQAVRPLELQLRAQHHAARGHRRQRVQERRRTPPASVSTPSVVSLLRRLKRVGEQRRASRRRRA